MQQQFTFERRDEFDRELSRRRFSEDECRLLGLMYDSVHRSDGAIQGQIWDQPDLRYVMVSPRGQNYLAHAAGLRGDTHLRAVCRSLESRGIFCRMTMPAGAGRQTAYVLSLSRLIDLPASDLQPALSGSEIVHAVRLLAQFDPFAGGSPVGRRRVAGGSPEGCRWVAGGLPVGRRTPNEPPPEPHRNPTGNDDDCLLNSKNIIMNDGQIRVMAAISDSDVRIIGGFAVDGTTRRDVDRFALFMKYWRDCSSREELSETDREDLLALFIHWSRRNPRPGSSKGAGVSRWWSNRHKFPLSGTLKPEERREAQRLTREAARAVRQAEPLKPEEGASAEAVEPLKVDQRLKRIDRERIQAGIDAGRRQVQTGSGKDE